MTQIRQGDVLLVTVKSLPKGAKLVPLKNGRVVLAEGEATGHAHAIRVMGQEMRADEITEALLARLKARLYEHERNLYLVVEEGAEVLQHEEHTAHSLPPGIFEIPVQMEYDASMMRRVAD